MSPTSRHRRDTSEESFPGAVLARRAGFIGTQQGRLPADFPFHGLLDERRVRAALRGLDLAVWHFGIAKNQLMGARRWPGLGADSLMIIGPDLAMAHRHLLTACEPILIAQGAVERVVQAVNALAGPGTS